MIQPPSRATSSYTSCISHTIGCNGRPTISISMIHCLIFGPDLCAPQMPSCTSCMILLASTSFTHFSNNYSWLLLNTSSSTNMYFKAFCFILYSVLDEGLFKYCLSSNLQSLFSLGCALATSMLFISFNLSRNPEACWASSFITSLSLQET